MFRTGSFSNCIGIPPLSLNLPPSMLFHLVDTEEFNEFGEKGKLLEEKIMRKQDPVSAKLASTSHHNKVDYWILVHEMEQQHFHSLLTDRKRSNR
jgi:hypothetical protein